MGNSMRARRRKWLITGGIGASLTGFGLCAVAEVGFLKFSGGSWVVWVPLGTLSLCVFILGLVFLIKAGHLEKK